MDLEDIGYGSNLPREIPRPNRPPSFMHMDEQRAQMLNGEMDFAKQAIIAKMREQERTYAIRVVGLTVLTLFALACIAIAIICMVHFNSEISRLVERIEKLESR